MYIDIASLGYDGYEYNIHRNITNENLNKNIQEDNINKVISEKKSEIYSKIDLYLKIYTDDDIARTIDDSYRIYKHPLMKLYIDNLPVEKYNTHKHNNYNICPIGFIDFEHGSDIKSLPCGHYFDPECIDEWLIENSTCPLCRHELKDEFED